MIESIQGSFFDLLEELKEILLLGEFSSHYKAVDEKPDEIHVIRALPIRYWRSDSKIVLAAAARKPDMECRQQDHEAGRACVLTQIINSAGQIGVEVKVTRLTPVAYFGRAGIISGKM